MLHSHCKSENTFLTCFGLQDALRKCRLPLGAVFPNPPLLRTSPNVGAALSTSNLTIASPKYFFLSMGPNLSACCSVSLESILLESNQNEVWIDLEQTAALCAEPTTLRACGNTTLLTGIA